MRTLLFRTLLIGVAWLSVVGLGIAGEKGAGKAAGATDLKAMSQDEKIKLALSAGPAHLAKDAGVMLPDESGKLVEVKKKAPTGSPAFPPSTTGPSLIPCALIHRYPCNPLPRELQ